MAQNHLFRRHNRGTRETEADESHNNELDNFNHRPGSSSGSGSNGGGDNVDTEEVITHAVVDVENPPTTENNANTNINNTRSNSRTNQDVEEEKDEDESQELVVRISSNNSRNLSIQNAIQFPNWTLNEEEINTRREAIRAEVERIQRSNFLHFLVLCLVPTSLLIIVIAAILSEDGECSLQDGGLLTVCEREPRTFVNAFTTRCICDAVVGTIETMDGVGAVGEGGP
jgi:hypothetical protein